MKNMDKNKYSWEVVTDQCILAGTCQTPLESVDMLNRACKAALKKNMQIIHVGIKELTPVKPKALISANI